MIRTTDTTDTTPTATPTLGFVLDADHEAHQPPEAGGGRRDQVRLLVSAGDAAPVHARFDGLGDFLHRGDLVVVNTSATIAAAVDARMPDGDPVVVHFSGELPGGALLVEVRQPAEGATVPRVVERPVDLDLLGAGRVQLHAPFGGSRRLWLASATFDRDGADDGEREGALLDLLDAHGRPIRYRHVPREWPIEAYQTVFAREPGSVEMPSAARPFSTELVTDLVRRGIGVTPLVLHTGVSSLEGDERPYPERYRVPHATATAIDATRQNGGRVIAIGTTVVRALATVTDDRGVVHPGRGWTELMVTADTPVRSVDGLVTGWHEPESTHLMMLESFAGRDALGAAYTAALDAGYLWHEFGDSHLILRSDAP
jgi:S-adenosylmethionine:tRNA ribosyltransferase-isomerase